MVNVPWTKLDEPLPPLLVPVVIVPSEARKTLPLATSEAVAVVMDASSNRAVPQNHPPYDIVKIFVVLS